MPELPEVEVVRRGLAAHALGCALGDVEVLHPRAVRRQSGGAGEFVALMRGRTPVQARRRGKFLWLTTDDPDLVLAAHLGMSGQFRVDLDPVPDLAGGIHPHARVRLPLGTGATLWFLDQRTFGWVQADEVVSDRCGVRVPGVVAGIAPDPTEDVFDPVVVVASMRRRSSEIKRLLLDQSIVSGIGNIYADEALWRAGVHPRRRADRLSAAVVRSVLDAAIEVMAEALAQGGTSFDSLYVNVNGESGYFARGLSAYGRTGEPCPRCSTPIRREVFMNRSSHLCPSCQPPPRAHR